MRMHFCLLWLTNCTRADQNTYITDEQSGLNLRHKHTGLPKTQHGRVHYTLRSTPQYVYIPICNVIYAISARRLQWIFTLVGSTIYWIISHIKMHLLYLGCTLERFLDFPYSTHLICVCAIMHADRPHINHYLCVLKSKYVCASIHLNV